MMGGVLPETCWAIMKHWNNKFYYTVASCWFFLWDLYYDARIHEHQIHNVACWFIKQCIGVSHYSLAADRLRLFWASTLLTTVGGYRRGPRHHASRISCMRSTVRYSGERSWNVYRGQRSLKLATTSVENTCILAKIRVSVTVRYSYLTNTGHRL
jgi:hypothetical protein